jgi:hypothetical protein
MFMLEEVQDAIGFAEPFPACATSGRYDGIDGISNLRYLVHKRWERLGGRFGVVYRRSVNVRFLRVCSPVLREPRPTGALLTFDDNFLAKALCAQGGTNASTFPPSRAISFTILELRYVYSSFGIRKIVSISGSILRFISAIWNSNSKSDTALRPLTIALAPQARANSTSRPFSLATRTLATPSQASSKMAIRSSIVNKQEACF